MVHAAVYGLRDSSTVQKCLLLLQTPPFHQHLYLLQHQFLQLLQWLQWPRHPQLMHAAPVIPKTAIQMPGVLEVRAIVVIAMVFGCPMVLSQTVLLGGKAALLIQTVVMLVLLVYTTNVQRAPQGHLQQHLYGHLWLQQQWHQYGHHLQHQWHQLLLLWNLQHQVGMHVVPLTSKIVVQQLLDGVLKVKTTVSILASSSGFPMVLSQVVLPGMSLVQVIQIVAVQVYV